MPGSIPSIFFIEPIFFICCKLVEEVLERELLGRELLGDLARLLLIERPLRLLDEGEDVAEVEDAARHAVGVEGFEVVEPFSRGVDDGRPVTDATESAAPPRASPSSLRARRR
jgi:hypothetical protein